MHRDLREIQPCVQLFAPNSTNALRMNLGSEHIVHVCVCVWGGGGGGGMVQEK